MKKSLVAMAVLAASGASFAQSNVTVYGLADIYFASTNNEAKGASLTKNSIDSGGVNTSRWGLKGSEDLGGGLKANFKLEQGFKLDTGAAGTSTGQGTGAQAFDRQSWVGFSGSFGEVQLGKSWSAYDDVSGASDAVFDSALSPMNYVFVSVGYTDRPINGIRYATPEVGGFSGVISYALGENKTATLGASSITSLSLSYGAGPLAVQFGYQSEDTNTTSNDVSYTRLGASYDLKVAAIKATYGKTTNIGNVSGAEATDWQFGVDYPVSTALTLSASYARSTDNTTAGDFTRDGYGIAAAYTLSKRTFLYGGYESDKTTKTGVADTKHSVLALGVQHKF
jgi:predicted porin